ncbi:MULTISPECIES: crotonase/enoyl-CoA hydratase family protein [Acidithrix]|uniref:Carnitinyl-CoA dehydratase n=1 Tax=Acidithrix ferrooxidans TaxID=1280514 RepID=A0A0D8HJR8_9ACTN|nr:MULTISPECIES: crotonase/enoyl-CoA hydratase family protein [Acidithrix]KJF18139.1 carnitinyl-CoA dehydratase [Acidithrix ferrooxidans]CAG4930475.1 unnamed protein product [Acidithrix sp. C25]
MATGTSSTAVEQMMLDEHIMAIAINRPEARNAINGAVAQGIEAAIDNYEANEDAWVAILYGNGTNFSAGADLKEIASGNASALATSRGGFAGIVRRDRKKPLIAAVHGSALAGGCEIALSADLIVATKSAKFGVPEVKRSLAAAAGGLFRLPKVLPRNLALEMILTGDPISAIDAHLHGMVNVITEDDQLLIDATALAKRIATNAPLAVRESLHIAKRALSLSEDELFSLSAMAMSTLSQTNDFREGPRAFIEKREPKWTGS